jgi:ribonuclease HII
VYKPPSKHPNFSSDSQDRFFFEREAGSLGYRSIAGVDEAGRGPLAGPLVVSACILPKNLSLDIDDSKKLSSHKRDLLFTQITTHPEIVYSIVVIERDRIDELNILEATMQGMKEAVEGLHTPADFVLVDGNRLPPLSVPAWAIVEGDGLSYSIGAASILAKVTRDRIMEEYHLKWPEYGFDKHKGYPTALHRQILMKLGPSPIHRLSYAPVRKALESSLSLS